MQEDGNFGGKSPLKLNLNEVTFDRIPLEPKKRGGGKGNVGDVTAALLRMKVGESIRAVDLGLSEKHARSYISHRNRKYPLKHWLVRDTISGLRIWAVEPEVYKQPTASTGPKPRKDFSAQLVKKDGTVIDV